MIYDRRAFTRNKWVNIDFYPKEDFSEYPRKDVLTLTLVTDGKWDFYLNKIRYQIEAPFVLCLNETDLFQLEEKFEDAAKTFVFSPLFINSALTPEALAENSFERIEDMHDRNLMEIFSRRNDNYNGLMIFDGTMILQLNQWLSICGTECQSQSDGRWTCRVRRYLLQVLYFLEDEFTLCINHQKITKEPVDLAPEYIRSNYHLGLTLTGVSKYVGMNRTTLNEACKKKTGLTVIQYLNQYRIRMARDALCHTNLKLNEIALCCGYNYESYFVKTFTEKEGISPTEYRKLHRK